MLGRDDVWAAITVTTCVSPADDGAGQPRRFAGHVQPLSAPAAPASSSTSPIGEFSSTDNCGRGYFVDAATPYGAAHLLPRLPGADASNAADSTRWDDHRQADSEDDETCPVNLEDFQEGYTYARPMGAPARPCTRGRGLNSTGFAYSGDTVDQAQARAQARVALPRGRRIVYIDRHHVHHHHHFHPSSEWDGPGCPLPGSVRKARERNAEADVESAHSAALGRKAIGRSNRSNLLPEASFGQSAPPSWSGFVPNTEFTADALVCRDPDWRAPGMIFSANVAPHANLRQASAGEKERQPIDEYFTVISRLNPENRLKFSPYGVPKSARASGRGKYALDLEAQQWSRMEEAGFCFSARS